MLVLGAGGYVGEAVVAAAREAGWEVVGARSAHADVGEARQVEALVHDVRPRAVINAAASFAEDPQAAARVNTVGAAHVAGVCSELGLRLVHVSTDCVHGGRAEPYPDDASPTPLAWTYAATKAAGETAVLASGADAALVRPSVVLGPGSRHLHCEGTYFTDMVRAPVHVADLASLLVALAASDVRGTLHAGGADEVTRHQIAQAYARSIGADPALVRAGTLAATGLARPGVLRLRTDAAAAVGVRLRGVGAYLPLA